MNAEEFLRSESVEDCAGGHIYRSVSLEDALRALKMARDEARKQAIEESVKPIPSCPQVVYGWVCPLCGSVYSPNTKECINCRNNMIANANCIINTVNYSGANKATAPLGELANMDKTQQPINNEIQ